MFGAQNTNVEAARPRHPALREEGRRVEAAIEGIAVRFRMDVDVAGPVGGDERHVARIRDETPPLPRAGAKGKTPVPQARRQAVEPFAPHDEVEVARDACVRVVI